MKPIMTLAFLGAAFAASAACFADDVAESKSKAEWFADFDKAVLAAKAQKKELLVDFTGSDWCGWCIRLHKEVFSTPEFEAAATKKYVLVALDFPQGPEAKAKVPNPARNQELAGKYGVEGYPTVLVMSVDGDVLGRGGYEKGGPEAWLAGMDKAAAVGREQVADAAAIASKYAAAADDAAKATVVAKASDRLEKTAETGGPTATLAAIARHGLELDRDCKSGVAARTLKALLAAGVGTEADVALAKKLDPKNDGGLMERALAAQIRALLAKLTSEEAVAAHKAEIEAFVAAAREFAAAGDFKDKNFYVGTLANACGIARQVLKDEAVAKEIAKALKEKGPKDDERLAEFLKQFLDDKDDKAAPPPDKK